MPGLVDYSKWELLSSDSRSEAESSQHRDYATSPRQAIRESMWASADAPLPTDPTLRAEILRDQRELAAFIKRNRCPSAKSLKKWLRRETKAKATSRAASPTFATVAAHKGWTPDTVRRWFHYPSFRALWESAGCEQKDAFHMQRSAGIDLYERGGRECMRFHYYALNHAMCGENFVDNMQKPFSAFGFVNHVDKVWDGIGSWRG